jgi:2-polyprenyl-3-methyl-5-hydroxy-6-metoxy-1,4-benzoquinol methylase
MGIDTRHRSIAIESMDDFNLEGPILQDALDRLAQINRYLGGNRITLQGIETLLKNRSFEKEISIVDLGCGNGDILRVVADFGLKNDLKLKLTGIDANEYTVNYARSLSNEYPNIDYIKMDITHNQSLDMKADIFLCTLTLHHFKDEEILRILSNLKRSANIGIVVNDLQRSVLAYHLFQIVCFVFRLDSMSREDGLLSILRGFKRKELIAFSKQLNLKSTLHWKWAFRYQWIISKA